MSRHLAVFAITASFAIAPAAQCAHNRAFWKSIVDSQYAVPEGSDPAVLIGELARYFGSRDPVLRDDYAYSIPAVWIYEKRLLPPAALHVFVKEWSANLSRGLDKRGDEPVLRRSFSALALSILAALDNVQPFLSQQEFDDLLTAAIHYLGAERDLRGFDPAIGWVHATAHTADLLKFLARSNALRPEQQKMILGAIATRIATADTAFMHDEDERLARVCISLLARSDSDLPAFRDWLQHISVPDFKADERVLIRRQNSKQFMSSLLLLLSTDDRFANSPAGREARDAVIAAVKPLV